MATFLTTAAAVAALYQQCSMTMDANALVTLAGIARVESGLRTDVIHDNTTGVSETGEQVVSNAKRLIAEHHSVDLGMWQINSSNLDLLHISVTDTFDLCKAAHAAENLLFILSRYNTGHPLNGIANGYVNRAMAAIRMPAGVTTPAASPPTAKAPQEAATLQSQFATFRQ
jgi:type IV secretion system protein VirB1